MKPNIVPSVFTFIKYKSSENQAKRRSPRKRHLITEFVKPKQKNQHLKSLMQIPLQAIFLKIINKCYVYENCGRLSFENMLLIEKVKVLEEEKNKLEEELKCSNVYAVCLKSSLFSYDNFITDEKLFRVTTGLEVERSLKFYLNI